LNEKKDIGKALQQLSATHSQYPFVKNIITGYVHRWQENDSAKQVLQT
jgi:hypothetical protein